MWYHATWKICTIWRCFIKDQDQQGSSVGQIQVSRALDHMPHLALDTNLFIILFRCPGPSSLASPEATLPPHSFEGWLTDCWLITTSLESLLYFQSLGAGTAGQHSLLAFLSVQPTAGLEGSYSYCHFIPFWMDLKISGPGILWEDRTQIIQWTQLMTLARVQENRFHSEVFLCMYILYLAHSHPHSPLHPSSLHIALPLPT